MTRTKKRLFFLLSILVIVTAFFFSSSFIDTFLPQSAKTPLNNLDKNTINGIVVSNGSQTIKLTKKNGQWLQITATASFPADTDRINTITEALMSLKEDSIVSTNPQNHKNFGIDKQKIEVVTVNKKMTIYIGDSPGIGQNYVRLDESNTVFIADGLDTVFTPFDYRDLSLHLIEDENKVDSVVIDAIHEKTDLKKKGSDWEVNGQRALRERVDFFINDIKTLKAQDIATDAQLTGSPSLILTISESSKNKVVSFSVENANLYYAQIDDQNTIYEVAAPYVTSLEKSDKDFTH